MYRSLETRLWHILCEWKRRDDHPTVGILLEACDNADVKKAAVDALKKVTHGLSALPVLQSVSTILFSILL